MAIIKHLEYRIAILEGDENPPVMPKGVKSLPTLSVEIQNGIKTHKLKKVQRSKKEKTKSTGLFAELSLAISHRRERIAPVTYPDLYTWEDQVIKAVDGLPL